MTISCMLLIILAKQFAFWNMQINGAKFTKANPQMALDNSLKETNGTLDNWELQMEIITQINSYPNNLFTESKFYQHSYVTICI